MKIAPWIPCTNCNAPIVVETNQIDNYFNNNINRCSSCNSNIDWWQATRNAIRNNFMLNQAFSVIGANSKIIEITLKPESRTCIKLSDHEIPINARVLYVNYTPQGGGLFPLEMHGNVPHRRILGDEIWLYPAVLSKDKVVSETKVTVMITWIAHGEDEIELLSITDAFDSYSNNQFLDSIIPANVAVESAISKLLSNYISKVVAKNRTEDFLTNAATYSSQLNVVLPLIVSMKGLPEMPDSIRGLLNKLRDYRNQIAHNGVTKRKLTKEDTADVLCASLFGLRYLSLIGLQLDGNN